VDVFRHHDVSDDHEAVTQAGLVQNREKLVPALRPNQAKAIAGSTNK
jgi:hypothetical protein